MAARAAWMVVLGGDASRCWKGTVCSGGGGGGGGGVGGGDIGVGQCKREGGGRGGSREGSGSLTEAAIGGGGVYEVGRMGGKDRDMFSLVVSGMAAWCMDRKGRARRGEIRSAASSST